MSKIETSVIIITINRKSTVLRLLECLSKQTKLPDEVIVVEGSDLEWSINDYPFQLRDRVQQVYSSRGSACDSRDKGAKISKGEILIFFDDDILIGQNYVKEACDFLSKHQQIMAVGGIYEDEHTINRKESSIKLGRLLRIYGDGKKNKILSSGWGDYVRGIYKEKITDAEWLFGCNSVVRKSVFEKGVKLFETRMEKWCFLEDLTVGARLTKKFGCCIKILPELKVIHDPPSSGGEISPITVRMRVVYRFMFWRNECDNKNVSSRVNYALGVIANIILMLKQESSLWVLWECLKANVFCLKSYGMSWKEANEFVFSKD